jgi:hypothetical protein
MRNMGSASRRKMGSEPEDTPTHTHMSEILMAVLPRLSLSAEILATHPGMVKQRVRTAFEQILLLRLADFPTRYQREFDLIIGSPPGKGNGYSRDWWDARFVSMHQKTAAKIAKRLFQLYSDIRRDFEHTRFRR